jgi:hypothetical protein
MSTTRDWQLFSIESRASEPLFRLAQNGTITGRQQADLSEWLGGFC